jgi:hypothetical protein
MQAKAGGHDAPRGRIAGERWKDFSWPGFQRFRKADFQASSN